MKQTTLKKAAVCTALFSVGLLFAQFARLTPASANTGGQRFDEKVNLALRRTAHLLLREAGDSTSRIAPVQHPDAGTFFIRMESAFDYDRLPALLQESFRLHDIHANYDVAVLDGAAGELQLGYNVQEIQAGTAVTCGGRAQGGGGYDLQVRFASPATMPNRSVGWWILAGGFLLGGFSYGLWQWAVRRNHLPAPQKTVAEESPGLPFGGSSLDLTNQTLLAGAVRHQLTYREAKLLHLFVSHRQQLLERDFILQAVWNDEGIIVGRSVDVFVSRLRKMLRDDPAVRIATVHGVGYRLEVADAPGAQVDKLGQVDHGRQ